MDKHAHLWLEEMIENHKKNKLQNASNGLTLPLKSDGKNYELEDLKGDQRDIACVIMEHLKGWLSGDRKPLHMTISGVAGTGKTVLIHTLVTAIRRMFGHDDSVHVVSPTGASANNAGGTTFHRAGAVRVNNVDKEMTAGQRQNLVASFRRTVAVIGDERSLLQSSVLGAFERNVASTAHGGGHSREAFGGIPLVVLIGDDGQLPPVESGAFDAISGKFTASKLNTCKTRGDMLFQQLSDTVMSLTNLKRQDDNDTELVDLLTSLREDRVTDTQATEILEKLHLDNFTKDQQKEIIHSDRTMHLFATREPMETHNLDCLHRDSCKTNPVALIKTLVSEQSETFF